MLLQTLAILGFVGVISSNLTASNSGLQIQDASLSKKEMTLLDGGLLPILPTCNYTLCGGAGIVTEVQIDCGGHCPTAAIPGEVCNVVIGFIPNAAAPSLILNAQICLPSGLCLQILEVELPNSAVDPDFGYTMRYSMVPNDILAGQAILIRTMATNSDTRQLEICIEYPVLVQQAV